MLLVEPQEIIIIIILARLIKSFIALIEYTNITSDSLTIYLPSIFNYDSYTSLTHLQGIQKKHGACTELYCTFAYATQEL